MALARRLGVCVWLGGAMPLAANAGAPDGFFEAFAFGCAAPTVANSAWKIDPELDQDGPFEFTRGSVTVSGLYPLVCFTQLNAANLNGAPYQDDHFAHTSLQIAEAEKMLITGLALTEAESSQPCLAAPTLPNVSLVRSWAYSTEDGGTLQGHIYSGEAKGAQGDEITLNVAIFSAHASSICAKGDL